MSNNKRYDFFLFLDFETTGEPETRILEAAWMLTDTDLNELVNPMSAVIHQDHFLMSAETTAMHMDNGLISETIQSDNELWEVETEIHNSIQPVIGDLSDLNNRITLAGFSCHYDRALIRRDMPTLDQVLHYRHFDVSVLRTAYHYWVEQIPSKKHERKHRAKGDVIASWEIAKAYMQLFREHLPKGLIEQGVTI